MYTLWMTQFSPFQVPTYIGLYVLNTFRCSKYDSQSKEKTRQLPDKTYIPVRKIESQQTICRSDELQCLRMGHLSWAPKEWLGQPCKVLAEDYHRQRKKNLEKKMGEKIFEMGMATSRTKRVLEDMTRSENREVHCYHHFGVSKVCYVFGISLSVMGRHWGYGKA